MNDGQILDRLKDSFPRLSPQLQKAARFIMERPEEVALQSMRTIARRAKVPPNAMLRLARELGYASYEPFRAEFKRWIVAQAPTGWVGRARGIQRSMPEQEQSDPTVLYVQQEIDNLQKTFGPETVAALSDAARIIRGARNVYILGLRSMFPVSFYLNYVCRLFTSKSVLMTGMGGTFADELRGVDGSDVLVAFSYDPYALDTVRAVNFARERGARVVAIADSRVAPIMGGEGVAIVVSNTADSLFPTLLPVFAVAQVLATLLVSQGSDETLAAIAQSERQLAQFGVYVK